MRRNKSKQSAVAALFRHTAEQNALILASAARTAYQRLTIYIPCRIVAVRKALHLHKQCFRGAKSRKHLIYLKLRQTAQGFDRRTHTKGASSAVFHETVAFLSHGAHKQCADVVAQAIHLCGFKSPAVRSIKRYQAFG